MPDGRGARAAGTPDAGATLHAGRSWRALRSNPPALLGGVVLVLLYLLAVGAPFVAPYGENDIDREHFYQPPQPLRLHDAAGRFRGPHVRAMRPRPEPASGYREDPASVVPLRWLVHGARYRVLGLLPADLHLYGVDPGERVYLLGADWAGRDQFTRLLYGARVSLTVGIVGIAISFTLGLALGGVAGYVGGWVDAVVMRATELLLTFPVLYLIVALRAAFPADLPSGRIYLAIVAILALVGWAGLARVVRGMVLAIRTAEFVLAAEALGMSRARVLVRHVLPNTTSFVLVAATIAVPGYILGEVFLSFLGVGVQEPSASWGNMLTQARGWAFVDRFPWLLLGPVVAIFATVMAFNLLGDGLRDAFDPRRVAGRAP